VTGSRYRIVLRGRLDDRFESAFDGMKLEPGQGLTVLVGEVRDQAHLYGVLDRLRDFGIDLELVPIEWNALIARFLQGFQHPDNAQLGAMNASYNFLEPFSAFTRFFHSASVVPKSINIMPYLNPEVDRLIEAAEAAFDPRGRDRLLAQVHEIIVDDAPWVFIVHDLNPRALSPKVKGYVQAQSWFQDLTPVWVEK